MELKPCPFCGNPVKVYKKTIGGNSLYAGICSKYEGDCWASVAPFSALWDTEQGALKAWNKRNEP